ncbi:MAG: L,D-transpeptidase family protein [Pseudomonadota bacterium]
MTDGVYTATAKGKFFGDGITCQCALGRGGIVGALQKREGDGASPLGTWRMKRVFYRPDRLQRPQTALPIVPLAKQDGWCDAPDHPLYNRPVRLPFAASHERLWRDDHAYDLVVELAYNDGPILADRGSAIFFHLAHDDYRTTQGCVAIAKEHMLRVLERVSDASAIEIRY